MVGTVAEEIAVGHLAVADMAARTMPARFEAAHTKFEPFRREDIESDSNPSRSRV